MKRTGLWEGKKIKHNKEGCSKASRMIDETSLEGDRTAFCRDFREEKEGTKFFPVSEVSLPCKIGGYGGNPYIVVIIIISL